MSDNIYLKSQLDTKELLLLDAEVKRSGKSMLVAYVLWYFLGVVGGHRFYLGKKGSAATMLILSITIVGLIATVIWSLVDAFLTYKIVNETNKQIESRLLEQIIHRSNHRAEGDLSVQ